MTENDLQGGLGGEERLPQGGGINLKYERMKGPSLVNQKGRDVGTDGGKTVSFSSLHTCWRHNDVGVAGASRQG